MNEETMTIWVCECCMLMHANGECCADDQHGGDGVQPWAQPLLPGQHATMGLLADEHDAFCDSPDDCDCATDTFSTSRCDGCGSYLHGERYGFTLWYPAA